MDHVIIIPSIKWTFNLNIIICCRFICYCKVFISN